jgi:hypothetical protein
MIPVGSTLVESIDTADGAVTTIQNAFQCRNAECESFTEDYIWTYNGECFIMHHLERPLEAA